MSRIETFTWLAPSGILNDTGDAPDMRIAKDSGSRAMAVVEITHMVKMAVVEPAALLSRTNFNWENLETPAYSNYLTSLRAVGCPDDKVRYILLADINELFARKRKEEADAKR